MALPRIRILDAFLVPGDGQDRVGIRDPENIQEETLLLPRFMFFISQLLDGQRDVAGVQEEAAKLLGGARISAEAIEQVVGELDRHWLLHSPRFEEKREEIEREFARAPVRRAWLANRSYPGERDELRKLLDGFFDKGPGAAPAPPKRRRGIAGLVAPHIDYHRGGAAYAHAYKAMAEMKPADVYVVLGVAHASPPAPFIVCDKSFETPFGTAPWDAEFGRRLLARIRGDPKKHALVHRTEHSIEFQVVYLKYLFDHPFTIVPILCSSFEPLCGEDRPSGHDGIEEFILALKDTIEETPGRVCVISGADLAHVGRRFGDDIDITPEVLDWVKRDDHTCLEYALDGDAEGFYASVMADGNRRKVCGLSSIYTAVRLLEKRKGKLLAYDSAPDPAGGIVSFASVVYPG
jgi:AmmeMemoRadiSam system protein B